MLRQFFTFGLLTVAIIQCDDVEAQGGWGPPPTSEAGSPWGQPQNAPEGKGGFGGPPVRENAPTVPWGGPPQQQAPEREPFQPPQQHPEVNQPPFGGAPELRSQPGGSFAQEKRPEEAAIPEREEQKKDEPREEEHAETEPTTPEAIAEKLVASVEAAWPKSPGLAKYKKTYNEIYSLAAALAIMGIEDYTNSGTKMAGLIYSTKVKGKTIYPKIYRHIYLMVRYIQAWLSPGKYANKKNEEDMDPMESAIKSSMGSSYWDSDIRQDVTDMYTEMLQEKSLKYVDRFLCSAEEVKRHAPQVVEKRCKIEKD